MNLNDLVGKRNGIEVVLEGRKVDSERLQGMPISRLVKANISVNGRDIRIDIPEKTNIAGKGLVVAYGGGVGFYYNGALNIISGRSGPFRANDSSLEFLEGVYGFVSNSIRYERKHLRKAYR